MRSYLINAMNAKIAISSNSASSILFAPMDNTEESDWEDDISVTTSNGVSKIQLNPLLESINSHDQKGKISAQDVNSTSSQPLQEVNPTFAVPLTGEDSIMHYLVSQESSESNDETNKSYPYENYSHGREYSEMSYSDGDDEEIEI